MTITTGRRILAPLVLALLVTFGCSPGPEETLAESTEELSVSSGFIRQNVDVHTPAGVVHTVAVYRLRGLRHERRVVMMVPGTLANGAGYYDVLRGTGYDAAEVLAAEGYIVALVDLPGTGSSYRPADGRDTGIDVIVPALRRVALRYMLQFAVFGGIDVYGETGVGTNAALALAREPWVRTISASATFYQQFGPAAAQLFDPGFHAFLDANPTGYLPQDPAQLAFFFGAADPAVMSAAITAAIGPAPQTLGTGAYYDLFAAGPDPLTLTLATPIVDAAPAMADALFLQGSPDFVGSEAGTAAMVAAYGSSGGGEAELVTIPGASHLMRFDAVIGDGPDSEFWEPLIEFLDSH